MFRNSVFLMMLFYGWTNYSVICLIGTYNTLFPEPATYWVLASFLHYSKLCLKFHIPSKTLLKKQYATRRQILYELIFGSSNSYNNALLLKKVNLRKKTYIAKTHKKDKMRQIEEKMMAAVIRKSKIHKWPVSRTF